ncbi:MAG: FkbM family methyltransferase [Acetobacteraceae bacterium]
MNSRLAGPPRITTFVPGGAPIALVAWYEKLADYYPESELQTKRWLTENVSSDWVVFDVGANVGTYSILFSRLAPQGSVHAFEPTTTIELLRRNLEFHQAHNVVVHEVAAGNRTGKFSEPIYRIWGQPPETLTYEFTTLDDFVRETGIARLDCIKIDVDGFDLEVLAGSAETLQRFNPWVIVELCHALATRGRSVGEAMLWLLGQGYTSAFVLDGENFLLKREPGPASGEEEQLVLRFDRRPVILPPAYLPGEPIADYFADQPALHNQAAIEAGEPGMAILAPGPRWSFAVSWPRRESAQPQGHLLIQAQIEVTAGAVGLGCLASDYRTYIGKEVSVAAATAWQTVQVFVPDRTDVACLMLRNVSGSGATARARIRSLAVSFATPSISPVRP